MEVTDKQYGSGSGSGSGYGYGYGYGDGYGDGYGSGYGSGYGDGDGSGSGSGDGDGSDSLKEKYLGLLLAQFRRGDSVIAFWRSKPDGTPANGGSGTKAIVGNTELIQGPLAICTSRALHGTTNPSNWKGERWWIVALHQPVQIREDKVASLKRTILADLGKCPF